MLNYSAINYGAVRKPSPLHKRAYTDTLQISMKTENLFTRLEQKV